MLVCVVYTFVGPFLILTNKYLLSRGHFPHPLLLTTITQFSSALISFVLVRVVKLAPRQHEFTWPFYLRNISALGCASAITLCLGNSTYLFLSMAFIEILKGAAPLVTMMVQICFGSPWPRASHAAAVFAISLGTGIASAGEVKIDPIGIAVMFGSIYFEAVRLIMTEKLLGEKKLHVLEGLYYVAPASGVWVAAAALLVDVPRLDTAQLVERLPKTWHVFLLVALLGFAVNIASFLVIKRTNVIMLKLLSISRNALVVFAGVICYSETVTMFQFAGYSLTLVSFVVYSVLQVIEPTK